MKGQAEELRHIKRGKHELQALVDRMSKEILQLHDANAQLKIHMKEVKTQVSGETSIDKIMASDPDLANELKSVARLQK